jgi:hypothetical protein
VSNSFFNIHALKDHSARLAHFTHQPVTTVTVAPHNLKRHAKNSNESQSMAAAMQAINDRNISTAFNYRQQSAKRERSSRNPDNQQKLLPSTYNLTSNEQGSSPREHRPVQHGSRPSAKHFNNKKILV